MRKEKQKTTNKNKYLAGSALHSMRRRAWAHGDSRAEGRSCYIFSLTQRKSENEIVWDSKEEEESEIRACSLRHLLRAQEIVCFFFFVLSHTKKREKKQNLLHFFSFKSFLEANFTVNINRVTQRRCAYRVQEVDEFGEVVPVGRVQHLAGRKRQNTVYRYSVMAALIMSARNP